MRLLQRSVGQNQSRDSAIDTDLQVSMLLLLLLLMSWSMHQLLILVVFNVLGLYTGHLPSLFVATVENIVVAVFFFC